MGPELKKTIWEVYNVQIKNMVREEAGEMASEMVSKIIDEKTSELAKRLLQKGIPCQDMAECMEFSVERVKKLQQELVQTV